MMAEKTGFSDLNDELGKNRLKWLEHVSRMNAEKPAKARRYVEVEGKR